MSTPAPLGGGIDVDVPPDFPAGGFAAIPYNRSGTQIFEDPKAKKKEEAEEIEEDIIITDEYLEELWNTYSADPNFFKQIEIAQDGGFSEVDELIGGMRYFTAGMALSFVILNVAMLTYTNIGLIFGGTGEDVELFLVSKTYIFVPMVEYAESITSNQSAWGPVITTVDDFIKNDKAILGFLSMMMLTVYVLKMVMNCYQIFFPVNEMGKWVGVQELFWNSLPEAATISEVKLLNYVTPAVVLPALIQAITVHEGGILALLCYNLPVFLITRALAALVGFDAFLFKLQTISEAMITIIASEESLGFWGWFGLLSLSGAFLNQMLGIVQLGWFVRKRIFAFIFAGEDGSLSAQEDALKETWESMLAQRIWQELTPREAIVAYLSYSDYDFQKLALETVKPGASDKPAKAPSDRRKAREAAAASAGLASTEMVNQGSARARLVQGAA